MTIFQSVILGIIQGLTEFLPISSSAHLVLAPYLFGWHIPQDQVFVFDVLVQLGTLVAVIIYFWKDLIGIITAFLSGIWNRKPFADPQARLGWNLILATIPAGILGLLLKSRVESVFSNPTWTALLLLATAGLLFLAERFGKRVRQLSQIGWIDSLWIGFSQALAIFPGISRSGATIAGAMTRDIERPAAARFSFLMSIPIMLAAGLNASLDLVKVPNLGSFLPVVLAGFISAAVVGYFSIRWLLGYLTKKPLTIFALYCILFSAICLIVIYV